MKLIIASDNKHKLTEKRATLAPFFDEMVFTREAGIAHETVEDGFGYDPLFFLPEYWLTR